MTLLVLATIRNPRWALTYVLLFGIDTRRRHGADHGEHGLSPPCIRNRQWEMVTKIGAGFRVAERRLWWAGRNSDPVG